MLRIRQRALNPPPGAASFLATTCQHFRLPTNRDFLRALLAHPDFIANAIDTNWVANLCDADGCYSLPSPNGVLLAMASVIWCQLNEPAQIKQIAWEVADVKERFSVSVQSEATTDYKVAIKMKP